MSLLLFSIIFSKIVARLFAALEYNPTLKYLADYLDDPDSPGTQVRRLYFLCRGNRTKPKYTVLNTALIWLSQYMIKLEYLDVDILDIIIFIKAQLQPNYIATNFRMLFAVFSENSIQYSLSKHFNQTGKSFWVSIFSYHIRWTTFSFFISLSQYFPSHLHFPIIFTFFL